MKKLIISLLLINIFSLSCFAAPKKNAPTDEVLEYIQKQAVKLNVLRMQKAWRQICKNDHETCTAKQEWYNNLLYETKTRRHDLQTIQLQMMNTLRPQ